MSTVMAGDNFTITGYDSSTGTLTVDSSIWANTTIASSDNTISSGTYYVQSQWEIPEKTPEELFKQIVSLLGIKINNVLIQNDKIVLYGTRNRKKYIIEITSNLVTIKDSKGKLISEIYVGLRNGDTITVPFPQPSQPQPYIYPYPGTISPNINPWTQPYTTITNTGSWDTPNDNYILLADCTI
jgi:hypothetical protein